MFAFRCFSTRFLARSLIGSRCRQLSIGVASPDSSAEQYQSTISLIKQDLQVIHRDILQVSKQLSLHLLSFF